MRSRQLLDIERGESDFQPMLQVYYHPRTRAGRVCWILEEMGLAYERVPVDLAADADPAYLAIHPWGAVPALKDGPLALIESTAIVEYLADRFPEKNMAPAVGTPERGLYYQWMCYAQVTLEAEVEIGWVELKWHDENERDERALEKARAKFHKRAEFVEKAFSDGRKYLLGEKISAADIVMGSVLIWANAIRWLEELPKLKEYTLRLKALPSYKKSWTD